MINLLGPDIKQQVGYAKRNARLLKVVWLLGALLVMVAATFIGGRIYLSRRVKQAESALSGRQAQIKNYQGLEEQAKKLSTSLTSFKKLQQSQSRFSVLLTEFAQLTPKGAFITSLALTGDQKKPVRITATANSYQTAASIRDALATSPRVSGVDIDSITSAAGGFNVSLTLAFKPGQNR